jgi:membrane protein DedA with SNARE-associated domain
MATDGVTGYRLRSWLADYGLLVLVVVLLGLAVASVTLFFVGEQGLANRLIDRYGLFALLCIFVVEGAMVLYFAPSESLVPAGMTFLASTGDGYHVPTVAAIFAVAVVGATAGQVVLFVLARRGGRQWLLEKPWFRITPSHLDRVDRWFAKWGRAAVPVSNALPFTRGMLTVPAGLADMSVREFAVLSAFGTLLFQTWIAVVFHYAVELGLFNWAGLG